MENAGLQASIEVVAVAAKSGARRVTGRGQVIEDAVESTIAQWENAILSGRAIENLPAWAHRVGMHEARRLGRLASSALVDDRAIEHVPAPEAQDQGGCNAA